MSEHTQRTTVLDPAAVVAARNAQLSRPGRRHVRFPPPLLPATTGSTNDDLAGLDAAHLAVLATLEQSGGKGRLGRDWVAPPGACLTFSVNLQAPRDLDTEALGWITVLVAIVLAEQVDELAGAAVAGVKWPNDLILDSRKVAGILARMVPGASGRGHRVVVGVGLNLDQSEQELPVPTATSLALAGLGVRPEELLGSLWARIGVVVDDFFAVGGDVHAPLSGLMDRDGAPRSVLQAARDTSSTLGEQVRVHLPGEQELTGTAVDLGADGSLIVRDATGEEHHVHAGDVVHLRRADGGYV